MRIVAIDENLSPDLATPLAKTYSNEVRFRTFREMGLLGVEDLDIFPFLTQHDVDLLVTGDIAQVERRDERQALAEANLHWIGIPTIDARGIMIIAKQLSIVIPAVGEVLNDWPSEPTAYLVGGPAESVIHSAILLQPPFKRSAQ